MDVAQQTLPQPAYNASHGFTLGWHLPGPRPLVRVPVRKSASVPVDSEFLAMYEIPALPADSQIN